MGCGAEAGEGVYSLDFETPDPPGPLFSDGYRANRVELSCINQNRSSFPTKINLRMSGTRHRRWCCHSTGFKELGTETSTAPPRQALLRGS
jgi:hypothetical protein